MTLACSCSSRKLHLLDKASLWSRICTFAFIFVVVLRNDVVGFDWDVGADATSINVYNFSITLLRLLLLL